MDNADKSIQTNDVKELESKLTPKNRVFLEYLSQGKTTLEAYKLSGYIGEDHAAYELKSKLSKDFEVYLTAKGMSRGDLMLAVKDLIDLPVTNRNYKSLKDHMKLLGMWMKMLPADTTKKPNITAFVINTHNASNARPLADVANDQAKVIDVEIDNP